MPERSEHGEERHNQNDRPTQFAFQDRDNPVEIYLDLETDNHIFVGKRGRTHVFLLNGDHHTSFWTTKKGRARRVARGKWIRVTTL